jgi:PQQ-dependent dehydrogenase (methanol/ethanol family)
VAWFRSTRRLALLSTCILAGALLAGCDIGGDDSSGLPDEQSSAIEETVGVADEANWATFGYTYDQNRHVPFDEITKENVTDLGKVWSVDFNKIDKDVPLGQQTFPVVVNGTMYATTHFNHIFAMDAKTGAVKWHFRPSKIGAFKNFGLTTNRGVAFCNGNVYMLTLDMRIIAVDAETGKLAREVEISRDVPDARPEFGYYQTVAPVCYKGKLIIGSSGADNGVRGFVMAYNADDLSPAWANPYFTVPPEGQDWRANGRFHGGGTSWMPATIDVETDTMYFSTANPSPDFFAALRPGNNPKVNSVIALNVNDGSEKWWRQQVPIDEWDYDTAQAPQLINGTVGGEERKVISIASKEGTWFLYDAETGDPIYERVKLLDRVEHPPLKPGEPVDIFPSALGGINYAPASYDPTTNYVINVAVESKSTLIQAKTAEDVYRNRVRGDVDTGAINGFGTTPKGWHDYGSVSAVDLATGELAWKVKHPEPLRGGVTTTAAGLGFFGGGDGTMNAFDTESGKILWKFQTGNQISAGPTIYEIDGKQYIAIAVGGTFTSSLGGTASRIDVFALGGSKQQGKKPDTIPEPAAPTAEGGADTPAQTFLALGTEPKTVSLTVNAAMGAAGGGLNFNGFNRGGMTVNVPQGWHVNVSFKNLALQSPHSAVVTTVDQTKETQPSTEGVFEGAATERAAQGITSGTQFFEFDASRTGQYALLCAVAGHAIGGQWNYLTVGAANSKPSIKLGNRTVTLGGS